MKCWNCHAETHGQLFCSSCEKILPAAPGATYFDLFGLPPSPTLDLKLLEQRFRVLSLKVHPDRFAQADPRERRLSLERTTTLNEGYRTLRDDERRALYLLKLHGVELDRDMPLDFLEEVMERREALDAARRARDLAAAQRMSEEVRSAQATALGKARQALQGLERSNDKVVVLSHAADALARVRYFTRFLEEVAAMEEELLA